MLIICELISLYNRTKILSSISWRYAADLNGFKIFLWDKNKKT